MPPLAAAGGGAGGVGGVGVGVGVVDGACDVDWLRRILEMTMMLTWLLMTMTIVPM